MDGGQIATVAGWLGLWRSTAGLARRIDARVTELK